MLSMKHTIKNYHINQNKSNEIKKQKKSIQPFNKKEKIHKKFCKSKLRTKLRTELNKRGVEFRSDSALCAKFINVKTDLSLDHIVQRMCEMKYLYEYCNMKSIREQVYMDYVNSGYVKNNEDTITTQAEKIALETHSNGIYPVAFPWENNKVNKVNKVNKLVDFDYDYDYKYGYQNIIIFYVGILISIFVGIFIVFVKNIIY